MKGSDLTDIRKAKLTQLLSLATSTGLVSAKQVDLAKQLLSMYEEGQQLIGQPDDTHNEAIEMTQCPHCRCVFTTKGEVTL